LTYAHSFAELSLKFPSADPNHQRGRTKGKANTRGLGVWLSQSFTFGSLAAAFGACFLRLQKATLGRRQYQRQVQGCAAKPWYLAVAKPRLRKPKGKVNVRYHSPAGPQGGRRW